MKKKGNMIGERVFSDKTRITFWKRLAKSILTSDNFIYSLNQQQNKRNAVIYFKNISLYK